MVAIDAVAVHKLLKCAGNQAIYGSVCSKSTPLVSAFWKYLLVCFETPRPSSDWQPPDDPRRMDAIRNVLSDICKKLGASVRNDNVGNLIVLADGKGAGANKQRICLQGHMDIVCSKNESDPHNFDTDPIEVRYWPTEDPAADDYKGWLKPISETTLGADNGVAIAGALAILECATEHPPLEFLFTVNEETDFRGALQLEKGTLESKILLNLDSEESHAVCIGCAGGFEHSWIFNTHELLVDFPSDGVIVKVDLKGCRGGHSGVDIHVKGIVNANRLFAATVLRVFGELKYGMLASVKGGSAANAISRECGASFVVALDQLPEFENALKTAFDALRGEYPDEIAMEFTVSSAALVCGEVGAGGDLPTHVLPHAHAVEVFEFAMKLHHGVQELLPNGDVGSSTNFATIEWKTHACSGEPIVKYHAFARSSDQAWLEKEQKTYIEQGDAHNFKNNPNQVPFPGWQPIFDSPFLETIKQAHAKCFPDHKDPPRVYSIHAGLECAAIMDTHPDLTCCSIGPDILGAHSPDERVNIASCTGYMDWLSTILALMATNE